MKMLQFNVGNNAYILPNSHVRSIEKMHTITHVPRTFSYIKGVTNLRGVVTPLIDLRLRFGMKEKKYDSATRIVVVKGEEGEVGLIVDEAVDILDLDEQGIASSDDGSSYYVNGAVKREEQFLLALDVNKVLEQ
ncbi:chemotaxis protein CheW [Priestia endophytica]|uniref:chemotaxis protein CheW n=1 Tax=Priestia endophytica TaxID=135735 RepID=UPI002040340B|nr:chemotaxis protein CheW [Priestia endophytica]MCM3539260.1 chemotaxis protein CheW [Priestia endophytica]